MNRRQQIASHGLRPEWNARRGPFAGGQSEPGMATTTGGDGTIFTGDRPEAGDDSGASSARGDGEEVWGTRGAAVSKSSGASSDDPDSCQAAAVSASGIAQWSHHRICGASIPRGGLP
jgi:hypothetical protein